MPRRERSKILAALERLEAGGFILPSPDEVERSVTASGGWSALQLAEWGIPWPPSKGWRLDLENRWRARNS